MKYHIILTFFGFIFQYYKQFETNNRFQKIETN